ncbi:hypothetical protein AAC387_Pa03g2386 [Persea americana]
MLSKILLYFLFIELAAWDVVGDFTYNGFHSANLSLDGATMFTNNGLLKLTNTTRIQKGHAFYPISLPFKDSSNGSVASFSTAFVFAIIPDLPDFSGAGIAFTISPTTRLTTAVAAQFMGLFNTTSDGSSSNHIVAVELDTVLNAELGDKDDNHVGIDINSLKSSESAYATYFSKENGGFKNLSLRSGEPMQVWIKYDGVDRQLNVTLSPINMMKPEIPLLSSIIDLSPIILDSMYVGFSLATGTMSASHYILGWSFKMNGSAQGLDISCLPSLPRIKAKDRSKVLTIGLPLIVVISAFMALSFIVLAVRRKMKFAEALEDWECEYKPHLFIYKHLYMATKGFRNKELLGIGGFGRVYRGVLPRSKIEVIVKRVSHESKQGMQEFVAEIVRLGRLHHKSIVQLLGYCRRKGELLLVYDYMTNGSLDKFLFDEKRMLNWAQRFHIIEGVASGQYYLHEKWQQVIVHLDIKASNILLDSEMNTRIGDFGLARLYDHGTNPKTTHVVGTVGYLAPELSRTGKATTSTDVYAFGAFMLEVICGRKPIDRRSSVEVLILVDWVLECWKEGAILEAVDRKLGSDFLVEEMELILKLGLLCSHPMPAARPNMHQIMQFLDNNDNFPASLLDSFCVGVLNLRNLETDSHGTNMTDFSIFAYPSLAAESQLSGDH